MTTTDAALLLTLIAIAGIGFTLVFALVESIIDLFRTH